jgi:hypothetical protein
MTNIEHTGSWITVRLENDELHIAVHAKAERDVPRLEIKDAKGKVVEVREADRLSAVGHVELTEQEAGPQLVARLKSLLAEHESRASARAMRTAYQAMTDEEVDHVDRD